MYFFGGTAGREGLRTLMAEQFDEDDLDMLDVLSGAANSDNAESLLRDGVVGEPERINAHFILITYAGLHAEEVENKLQWLNSFQGRAGGLSEYTNLRHHSPARPLIPLPKP